MIVLTRPEPPRSADLDTSGPLVLVVDDEPCIAEYLAMALTTHGYATVTATSLADVARVLQKATPQLAVVDVALGHESGVDVARYLGEHLAELGVLFTSGYASELVYVEGMPPHVRTGFLQKVFSPAQLMAALRKLEGASA